MFRNDIIKGLKWIQCSPNSDVERLVKFVENIYEGKPFKDIRDDASDKNLLTPAQVQEFKNILRDVKSLPAATIHQFAHAMSQKNSEGVEWTVSEFINDSNELYVLSLKNKSYRCITRFDLICSRDGNNSVFISVDESMVFVLNLFLKLLFDGLVFIKNTNTPQNLVIRGDSFAEKFSSILEIVQGLEGNVDARTRQYLVDRASQSLERLPLWGGPHAEIPLGETVYAEPFTPPPSPMHKLD